MTPTEISQNPMDAMQRNETYARGSSGKQIGRERKIIIMARVLSLIFTPFYLPLLGLAALFTFTYMSFLPWDYKLWVLFMAYLFTVLLPTLLIRLYRRFQGWSLLDVSNKEKRMVPYVIAILCYFVCYYVMTARQMPTFIADILVAALVIQVVCAIVNVWWKISTHTAAIGGVEGLLVAFSFLFDFNPIWWFCLVLILAGMVGSGRMILRQHTLGQVVVGFLVGMAVSFWIVI